MTISDWINAVAILICLASVCLNILTIRINMKTAERQREIEKKLNQR